MVSKLNLKIFRDLMRMKAQVITIGLVVASAITVMVTTMSAHDSLKFAQENFYQKYLFPDLFIDLQRVPRNSLSEIAKLPGVQTVQGEIEKIAMIHLEDANKPAMAQMVGIPDETQWELSLLHLRAGRLPRRNSMEVVISEAFAKANAFNLGSTFKVVMNGIKQDLSVVGIGFTPDYIYAVPFGAAPLPDHKHFGVLWIPEEVLGRAYGMSDAVNHIKLRLSPTAQIETLKKTIDDFYKSYSGRGSYSRDRQRSHMLVSSEINEQKVMATVLPPIFLAVAAFLLHIVLSRLVSLQRSQIATLKACGYSNWTIALHYLKMVTIIVVLGSIPGFFISLWVGPMLISLYQDYFAFPEFSFLVTPSAFFTAFFAAIAASWIGAGFSVYNIAQLTPADAMRPPAPPSFHKSILERMRLFLRLSTRLKMLVRSLVVKPLRSIFAIIGMAAANSIVLLALFWSDAADYMMSFMFSYSQREDMGVMFLSPRPPKVLDEINKIPGVLYTEGLRNTGATIRFKNFSEDFILTGIDESQILRNLISIRFEKIKVPPEGVLINKRLKDKWGLEIHDIVELEILEDQKRILTLPIAGFTDDLIGFTAYMDIHALRRVLDEQTVYSQVLMKVDSSQVDSIYERLKNFPMIASITSHSETYKSLSETMQRSILVFASILSVFSVLIAVGIIYNTARVSLSEKSWELASLRILGLTKIEMRNLFFGELIILIIPAIPLGWLAGNALARLTINMMSKEFIEIPFKVQPSTYALSSLIMVIAFILSSALVRRNLDRLQMVEALKSRE